MAKKTAKKKKKVITSAKRRTAKDFMPNVIDLGDGTVISGRLRLGGMQYLEDKHDCALGDFIAKLDSGRIFYTIDFLVAMLIGDRPDKTVEELQAIVRNVDISVFQGRTGQLAGAIEIAAKETPKKKAANQTTV